MRRAHYQNGRTSVLGTIYSGSLQHDGLWILYSPSEAMVAQWILRPPAGLALTYFIVLTYFNTGINN